jgi:hypothetical protein
MVVPERLKLAQDEVKQLAVLVVVEDGVLQERECGAVGDGEFAEQVLAPVEQVLEQVQRRGQFVAQSVDPSLVRRRLRSLGFDLVRRTLPDVVEPVEEDVDLRTPRGLPRKECRLRLQLFEVTKNDCRIGDDSPVVNEHRDERLAAYSFDLAAVGGIDVDPLDLDLLMGEGQRNALDVRRKRDAVDTEPAGYGVSR